MRQQYILFVDLFGNQSLSLNTSIALGSQVPSLFRLRHARFHDIVDIELRWSRNTGLKLGRMWPPNEVSLSYS